MNSNGVPESTNNNDKFKLETGMGPSTDKFLNLILDKLAGYDFKDKFKIFDPITNIVNEKIRPYIYISIGLYFIILILLIIIIYLLIKRK